MLYFKDLLSVIKNKNRLIKIVIPGLFLLFNNTFIYAQDKGEIKDKIHWQNVKLKIDKIDKPGMAGDHPYFHIALDYDYGDSFSLFVKGKTFYNIRLIYVPDTNSSFYPYNRALLKLSKKQISNHSKCQIIFRDSKRKATFRLNREFEYYSLEMLKNSSIWHLNYSNTYPWPN